MLIALQSSAKLCYHRRVLAMLKVVEVKVVKRQLRTQNRRLFWFIGVGSTFDTDASWPER